ncbi:PQQ-like beta-propeller repeat protein [Rubripirellula amarantea]|nr:PQQ-like beta-propeller repeat protein [Rubripirellula amarantea]
MNRYLAALMPLLLSVCPSVSWADNWPHWRGDGGNGVAENANPPTEFSNARNVKWKVAIPGQGSGSPAVWEDKIFVTTGVPVSGTKQVKFTVLCIDRATGKTLWEKVAVEAVPHEGTHQTNGFASASPCTDGTAVYAFFGSRGLFAYSIEGELLWNRDFGDMTIRNNFGEGASTALHGDHLFVPWDHEGQSKLYAVNKLSGDIVWQVDRDEPSNWGTPLVIESEGQEQVILTGQNKVRAYELGTGKPLWECGGQTDRPAASPVAGDGLVFVASGFRGAFVGAFRPDGNGDIEGTDRVIWTRSRDTPDIASPLLSGDRLYYYKAKTGLLTCVNAKTGEPYYSAKRIPELDTIYASPVAAGGYVYLSDRDGTIVVIKDDDNFELVATNQMGETVDATPAPVDDQLIVRGSKHLFCLQAQ